MRAFQNLSLVLIDLFVVAWDVTVDIINILNRECLWLWIQPMHEAIFSDLNCGISSWEMWANVDECLGGLLCIYGLFQVGCYEILDVC